MPAPTESRQIKPKGHQDGVAAIEFALVVSAFLILMFGIMELARVMYMFNTLADVTRSTARAAANISFNDQTQLDLARKRAVFDEANGVLPFGAPITYQNIRIEYLYLPSKSYELLPIPAGSMPSCPARNRLNCMIGRMPRTVSARSRSGFARKARPEAPVPPSTTSPCFPSSAYR
jgi:hypothetical protein